MAAVRGFAAGRPVNVSEWLLQDETGDIVLQLTDCGREGLVVF